ncbi:MAG TPA: glycosyltransferase family 4 protein [Longimicrobiales bacterium]|nr:glycosyltransferase family 4 protein [Longimicrobiales bacterium]
MKSLPAVVVVHNRYRESGGEDTVFEQETALLRARGHRVVALSESNDSIGSMSVVRLTGALLWNRAAARRVSEAVTSSGAGLVHFHNTFPLVSPAAYYAARRAGAAVVQTLHNYRLICPGTMLMRDGKPCEACVGAPLAWRGALHGCYRNSRLQSAGAAAMVGAHRLAGTWTREVDAYIALTPFARDRFVDGGLPPERVHVRPNFLPHDPGIGEHDGDYALFVGRLDEQKGVRTLMDAWRRLDGGIPLRVIGEGDLGRDRFGEIPGVEWAGRVDRPAVLAAMKRARALVLPSVSYENFPMTVVEAFATGLPVIASRIGGIPQIVEHEVTGLTFDVGSPEALAAAVERGWRDPESLRRMGGAARAAYETSYTAERAYASLASIYRDARRNLEG